MTLNATALSFFLSDTSGAVTVDWVVLAAAVVGLGVSSVAAVRSGALALGSDIQTSLTSASVVAMPLTNYSFRVMTSGAGGFWNNINSRIAQSRNFSDSQLLTSFEVDVSIPFEEALVSGFNDPCDGCRGAGNRLDLMQIQLAELERRGLATQEMRDYVQNAELRYNAVFP